MDCLYKEILLCGPCNGCLTPLEDRISLLGICISLYICTALYCRYGYKDHVTPVIFGPTYLTVVISLRCWPISIRRQLIDILNKCIVGLQGIYVYKAICLYGNLITSCGKSLR